VIAAGWTTVSEVARFKDVDLEIEACCFCQPEKEVGKEGSSRPTPDDGHSRTIVEMQTAGVFSGGRSQALGQGWALRKASHRESQ
jgi:hypothetical protein